MSKTSSFLRFHDKYKTVDLTNDDIEKIPEQAEGEDIVDGELALLEEAE